MSYLSHQGYVVTTGSSHPRAHRGRIFEHILVLEKKLGRPLLPGEVTHHLNGLKIDNRPENLEVKAESAHNSLHQKGRHVKLETKNKLRVLHKGMTVAIETRLRMSEARKHRPDYHGPLIHTCPVCRNEFTSSDKSRTYCSYACSNKGQPRGFRGGTMKVGGEASPPRDVKCPHCGQIVQYDTLCSNCGKPLS